jgi:magnesium chelatase subunit I
LGLRGQAKTRIARLLVNLLDEYVPYIEGSELFDDPLAPISWFGHNEVLAKGDATPIAWLHRSDRYTEKLATPDVTVADLIGDVDPIKAATMKLTYSDERVIHFGLIFYKKEISKFVVLNCVYHWISNLYLLQTLKITPTVVLS